MSTRLASGPTALLAGSLALLASATYPVLTRSLTPGYALAREKPLASAKQIYNLPGLSTTDCATVFLVLNKTPAAEDLRMMCSIVTAGDTTRTWAGYTGRNYMYHGGVTANTYNAPFVNMVDKTVLDNERTILLTIKFFHGRVVFYLNGVLVATESTGDLGNRVWTNDFMLGGEPSTDSPYTWQGLISACYLYLSDLSDADRSRTEGYLLGKYPAIT
jgi:hypothetical protein